MFFHKLSSSTFSLLISLTITSFGFLFFYQRFPDAPSLLNTFTYDAQMYLNIVDSNTIDSNNHFYQKFLL